MIFDKLTNISAYKGLNKNLDIAIDYILSHDLSKLPLGRTEIAGELVYANVMEASSGPLETRNFELHKKYMDIQIDLSGVEIIDTGDSGDMAISDFKEEQDFGTAICPTLASCTIGPGNFILCMAGEPHKPGIAASKENSLKKCVVKVHI